jgi:hypothetical protein
MKARIGIDKKVKQRLQEQAKIEVQAEYERQGQDIARRQIKLWLIVMNEVHKHGKKRSLKSLERFSELSSGRTDDEVFWYHIDERLEQMGFDFPRENYETMDL